MIRSLYSALLTLMFFSATYNIQGNEKPNIIIVITDDQGYGDLACHGNPIVKTPYLDKFYQESLRLNNYHVDPTCAPTRAALMTGRYSGRVGVWHTIQGRNMLRSREITMADILRDNGYETGLFGKWHLGDAYPFRPQDRGFTQVVMHGAGGIEQSPDYWGNDYFDDHYSVNGQWTKFEGYCTNIWYNEAMKFMLKSKKKNKPFFSYISLNAPHGPKRAPNEYRDLYKDQNEDAQNFFGMITNLDKNFGRLQSFLKDNELHENTILIFTTDNGSSGGGRYFSVMKGNKNSEYEGGHRVPFFISWPKAQLTMGKDINTLTSHMDILPTFIDMIGLNAPKIQFDGSSLKGLLENDTDSSLSDRTLFVESQRIYTPEKWRKTAVMYQNWRLINGKELYDLKADPMQKNDVAAQFPEIFATLTEQYDHWWKDVSAEHHISSRMTIGSKNANPATLTAHDLMGMSNYSQNGIIWKTNKEGTWNLTVDGSGEYEISIRRWPAESDLGINETCNGNQSINTKEAYLNIQGYELKQAINLGDKEISFKVKLQKGDVTLSTGFVLPNGKKSSANYVYVLNKTIAPNATNWQTRESLNLPLARASIEYKILPKPSKKKRKR